MYGPRKRLRSHPKRGGYLHVGLYRDGERRSRSVHSLIAEAFHGPRPSDEYDADHVSRVRTDNCASNLRWLPASENRRFGGGGKGEANANSRLMVSDVREIRRRRALGEQCTALGAEFGVTKTMVSFIARGKSWSHI
ncbi:HNH endonuclease signature motif containing protein [Streptomyces sp. NPDC005302]|uniref:HNH endonuclease signature motif containing protein n=1 Tax=Streptomyces sp. NPDC005302 TaxID=3154675 RepID=UPI00339F6A18